MQRRFSGVRGWGVKRNFAFRAVPVDDFPRRKRAIFKIADGHTLRVSSATDTPSSASVGILQRKGFFMPFILQAAAKVIITRVFVFQRKPFEKTTSLFNQ